MRAIVVSVLFSLALALTACTKNYYLPASLDNLLLKIDVPESPHPSWLSENYFIKIEQREVPNFGPYYLCYGYCFYSNNTYSGFFRRFRGKYTREALQDSLKVIFLNDPLSVYVPTEFYPHYIVNDTLKLIKRYQMDFNKYFFRDNVIVTNFEDGAGTTIGNFTPVVSSYRYRFIVDTVNKTLYFKEPHYRVTGKSFATINDPTTKTEGPYLPFPVKLPPYDKSDPINYWHPFRKWKARLDSINAGQRPPEVYVPR